VNKENHEIFESYKQVNEGLPVPHAMKNIGGLQYGSPTAGPPGGPGTVNRIKDKYRSVSKTVGKAMTPKSAIGKTIADIAKAAVNKTADTFGRDYGYLDTGEQLEDFASKLFGAHEWNKWIKENLLQNNLDFDGDVIIYRSAVMSRRKAPTPPADAVALEHEKMPQLFQYLLTWKKKYDTVYHVNGDDLGDGWQAQGGGWRGSIEVKMQSPDTSQWPVDRGLKLRRAIHLITKLFNTDGKSFTGKAIDVSEDIEDKEQAVLDHNGGGPAAKDESGNDIDLATKLPSPFGFSGEEKMIPADSCNVLLDELYSYFNNAADREAVVTQLKVQFIGSDNGIKESPYDMLALREIAGMEPFMGKDKNGFPWPTQDYDADSAIGRNPAQPAGVSAHFIKLSKDLSSLSVNEQREQILTRLAVASEGRSASAGETMNFLKEDIQFNYMKELIESKISNPATGLLVHPPGDLKTLVGNEDDSPEGEFLHDLTTDDFTGPRRFGFAFSGSPMDNLQLTYLGKDALTTP
jgi:hypothetical protein